MAIRVLIVEDDPMQMEMLQKLLDTREFYVETATNGVEALHKVRIGWFDIVLMDYMMPEVDGYAAARLIADFTSSVGRPRVIALSASPERLYHRVSGTPSVFDAVATKPWNPQTLLAMIRSCYETAPKLRYHWPTSSDVHHVDADPHDADAAHDEAEPHGDLIRVLVVEDDDALLTLLKVGLAAEGYDVETAMNGLEAMRMVAMSRYDLVLIDYQMPEIDGLVTARLIFELVPNTDRPRLIALTARPDSLRDKEIGTLSVFDDIIPKSIGLAAVLEAVRRCAEYKRRRSPVEPVHVLQLASKLGLVREP